MPEKAIMKTETFIKQVCKFAARPPHSTRYPPGKSQLEWEAQHPDDFQYPYSSDENPYEDYLRGVEIEYNPTTQVLTLIPNDRRLDKRLQIVLTDEQAAVLDVLEDQIHQEHVESVNDSNSDALVDWGIEYAKSNGYGKDPFVFHDKQNNALNIYPDSRDPNRTYKGTGIDLPIDQITGAKQYPLPTKKIWKRPIEKTDTEA